MARRNSQHTRALPFFSIITVTLNAGDLLRETMASIAVQDFDDCEWIVKDAGSTDGSLEALRTFTRFPIKVVEQLDSGIYAGMNQALREATGTYVHFLNAGDTYSSSSALAQVFAAIGPEKHPALLYTYYNDLATRAVVTYPSRIGTFFLYRSTICHQAQYLLREALEQSGGYDTTYQLCADRGMLLELHLGSGSSAQRIPFSSVTYHGRGVSAKMENLALRNAEHRRLDLAYFSFFQRFFFESIKRLTFAKFRGRLVDQSESTALTRGYALFRNIVRRWI